MNVTTLETPIPIYLRDACRMFVERSETLSYKGKHRDNAAVDFMLGTAVGARLAGDFDMADNLSAVATMHITAGGYHQLAIIASRPTQQKHHERSSSPRHNTAPI